MPEARTVINLNNTHGLRVDVWDVKAVPDDIWLALQRVQYESLRSQSPSSEWESIGSIVKMGDFTGYRDTRVNPQLLVGKEWNDDQLFRDPRLAVIYQDGKDVSDQARPQVIGGVIEELNTSNSIKELPHPFDNPKLVEIAKATELRAKMYAPVLTPIIGGKKHVHLREAYVHPDAQRPLDVDDANVVNGIVLIGTYMALSRRNSKLGLAVYIMPSEPKDQEMVRLTEAMELELPEGEGREHHITGYEGKMLDARSQVGQATAAILERDGMKAAIKRTELRRVNSWPLGYTSHKVNKKF
jgi:hypothetical protein